MRSSLAAFSANATMQMVILRGDWCALVEEAFYTKPERACVSLAIPHYSEIFSAERLRRTRINKGRDVFTSRPNSTD